MPNFCSHAPLFATDLPTTLTRFLGTQRQVSPQTEDHRGPGRERRSLNTQSWILAFPHEYYKGVTFRLLPMSRGGGRAME